MSGFISFLKSVGSAFKKGLPVVLKAAQIADVGISVVNPALGGIINTSIATVLGVEQKFAAMGQQSGTGPQKLSEAVTILYPAFEQIFGQYGVKIENSHVENYINAIVAALNAFPALPAQPAATLPANIVAENAVIAAAAKPAITPAVSGPAPDAVLNKAG
jgi:hypothetical protein